MATVVGIISRHGLAIDTNQPNKSRLALCIYHIAVFFILGYFEEASFFDCYSQKATCDSPSRQNINRC